MRDAVKEPARHEGQVLPGGAIGFRSFRVRSSPTAKVFPFRVALMVGRGLQAQPVGAARVPAEQKAAAVEEKDGSPEPLGTNAVPVGQLAWAERRALRDRAVVAPCQLGPRTVGSLDFSQDCVERNCAERLLEWEFVGLVLQRAWR